MNGAKGNASSEAAAGCADKTKSNNPERIYLARMHRKLSGGFLFPLGWETMYRSSMVISAPESEGHDTVKSLKQIYLSDMSPFEDKVYDNRVLVLTLIENPVFGLPSVHFLGEDGNGKVIRLCIYDIEQNKETATRFAFGTQIGIINPYHRISIDGGTAIRVDNPIKVVILGGKENMCRYCGTENSEHKCSKCKATYCSRECQVADWKKLQHKYICEKK